jgi:hypothetical protein
LYFGGMIYRTKVLDTPSAISEKPAGEAYDLLTGALA